ncbi:hypothetical protein ACFQL0_04645 [Haloplanus litoreus]|uniref:hypothetical protein n=1 Tax=Haloplanus litoreus TaxID=767515 RepID=UPI0036196837
MVVQEFADDDDQRTVTMVADAAPGRADAMAEAAATVGYALLDEGVAVSLTTPAGQLLLTPGDTDRLLAHLARVGDGDVGVEADVAVRADEDTVTVRVDGTVRPFDPGRRRPVGGDATARTDDGTRAAVPSPSRSPEVRA